MKKNFKIILSLVIFSQFLFIQPVKAATNISTNVQHYYVRTMSTNSSTQIGSYEYTTNPFYTANITEKWLPRLIGFDGNTSTSFNASYVYTLSYRFNYTASTDFFDWQHYMNYANFKIYGSTNDLFSCSIISNTSSYTDVKCTFKRSTSDNYFFFYFDFYDNSNALKEYGIPGTYGPQLSFTDISLSYVQDNSDIEVEQNNVIINQNNQTNQKLDDLNSTITDDTIDNSNANSFFDSFTTTDHGGISGIISAPLTAINAMLNKNCTPLTATYKGKEISLPCGYDFWNKMPQIQEFINITLGGLLCYRIILKLYRLIENIKNPDDDRVEVMKL